VGCLGNGNCSGGTPICDPGTKKCATCLADNSGCSAPKPFCDTSAGTGSCVGCRNNGDCVSPKTCDGTKTCVGGTSPDGQPCTDSSQCLDGLCMTEASWGMPKGECSGTCTTLGAACAGGGVCVQGGSGNYCRTKCSCSGTYCSNNGGCRAGYGCATVLYDASNQASQVDICIPICNSNSQCSSGQCNLYSGWCEATSTRHKTGDTCTQDSDCESYYCLTDATDGWPNGYCTTICNSSDPVCPDGNWCNKYDSYPGVSFCYEKCTYSWDCPRWYTENYSCWGTGKPDNSSVCWADCFDANGYCTDSSQCCSPLTCDTANSVCK
jgi:hypothetical protein